MIAGSASTAGGGAALARQAGRNDQKQAAHLDQCENDIGEARLTNAPDVERRARRQQEKRRPYRRHIDINPQIAAKGYSDGCAGGGGADQDHGGNAEREPIGLGPGAANVYVFRAGMRIGSCHFGVGESREKRNAGTDHKTQPQALLRQACRGADDRVHAGADNDTDAVENEFHRAENRFERHANCCWYITVRDAGTIHMLAVSNLMQVMDAAAQ
jgi:hypothetical protein